MPDDIGARVRNLEQQIACLSESTIKIAETMHGIIQRLQRDNMLLKLAKERQEFATEQLQAALSELKGGKDVDERRT